MEYQIIESPKGKIANVFFSEGEKIENYRSFFDMIMESPAPTTAIEKGKITDDFFNLSTGLAGDVLQKVSNYRKRLVILGNFSEVESKSLRDFIYESNRTGQVIFIDSIEQAIALLK